MANGIMGKYSHTHNLKTTRILSKRFKKKVEMCSTKFSKIYFYGNLKKASRHILKCIKKIVRFCFLPWWMAGGGTGKERRMGRRRIDLIDRKVKRTKIHILSQTTKKRLPTAEVQPLTSKLCNIVLTLILVEN